MYHCILTLTTVTAISAALCATGAAAATPAAPIAACKWDHREFQNLGNGDYTLRFAPLAEDDDRSVGGYLGYLTIHHPLRGQIYHFDLFQGNGYARILLLETKPKVKAKKQARQGKSSDELELYEFDENLRMAIGAPSQYIFIPHLGEVDYYNGRPTDGKSPMHPRDLKLRLNDNLWKFVSCR